MKVGDLVTLSAYGKRLQRTGWIQPSDLGVITKVVPATKWMSETFFINWVRSHPAHLRWYHEKYALRRDLVYAKNRR